MARTAHSVSRRKRVKKILKIAKGARFKRSKNYRRARETVKRALVYAYRDSVVECVEQRATPQPGSGEQRWQDLAATLEDCQAILTNGVGPKPEAALKRHGTKTIVTEGLIEETLTAYFEGRPLASPVRSFECGAACVGDGTGCG